MQLVVYIMKPLIIILILLIGLAVIGFELIDKLFQHLMNSEDD